MNYFNLGTSTDLNIIGRYPQVSDLTTYQPSDIEKSGYSSQIADRDLPDLSQFLLNNNAILTDSLISTFFAPLNGFLISQRARYIFEQFLSADIGYFHATVHCFKETFAREGPTVEHVYCFLRVRPAQHIYDYQQSFFEVREDFFGTSEGQIAIQSYAQLKEANNKLATQKEHVTLFVAPSRLKLTQRVDMFNFPFSRYVLVSSQVKEAIEQAELTGFTFEEVDGDVVF